MIGKAYLNVVQSDWNCCCGRESWLMVLVVLVEFFWGGKAAS